MTDLERMTQERDGWCFLTWLAIAVMAMAVLALTISVHRCIPQPCVQPKAGNPWQVPGSPADLPEGQ